MSDPSEEIDDATKAALAAADAAAKGEPPASEPVEIRSEPEPAQEAEPQPEPALNIPSLAQQVQGEARKVDLLYKEISAASKRLQLTSKGVLAAVLTHAAHIALRENYPAQDALREMMDALRETVIQVSDRVRFVSNGAVGTVKGIQEKTGWAVVKWDHLEKEMPADISTLEKLT